MVLSGHENRSIMKEGGEVMPTRARLLRRTVSGSAALLVLLSCSFLRAADCWEKKTYTEWTMPEAQKVLTDSPWSRVAIVQSLRSPTGLPIPSVITERPRSGGKCQTCGRQGDPAIDAIVIGASSEWERSPVGQVIYFRVVCFSSTRIRQALIRLSQLNGNDVPPPILDSLRDPLADYVIALAGPFISAFEDASLDSLKTSTYLRSRKKTGATLDLKQFVSPAERADGMALFFFPRGTPDSPPFEASDGQVEFATGEGTSRIKVSFKLDKMTVDGTLDF
jgi:hypothetical protein